MNAEGEAVAESLSHVDAYSDGIAPAHSERQGGGLPQRTRVRQSLIDCLSVESSRCANCIVFVELNTINVDRCVLEKAKIRGKEAFEQITRALNPCTSRTDALTVQCRKKLDLLAQVTSLHIQHPEVGFNRHTKWLPGHSGENQSRTIYQRSSHCMRDLHRLLEDEHMVITFIWPSVSSWKKTIFVTLPKRAWRLHRKRWNFNTFHGKALSSAWEPNRINSYQSLDPKALFEAFEKKTVERADDLPEIRLNVETRLDENNFVEFCLKDSKCDLSFESLIAPLFRRC